MCWLSRMVGRRGRRGHLQPQSVDIRDHAIFTNAAWGSKRWWTAALPATHLVSRPRPMTVYAKTSESRSASSSATRRRVSALDVTGEERQLPSSPTPRRSIWLQTAVAWERHV